jgi:phosphoribosyl-ATP pyrophosphohydrolase/phosphoribosyl-AMP cyclohydrolase
MNFQIEDLKFDDHGLIPAIVQDAATHELLMLAYVNVESLRRTLETGETWFWSRSRRELWHKGATSGNTQRVIDIRPDCDRDALLIQVAPAGPACHTGARTCFDNEAWRLGSGVARPERRSQRGGGLGDFLQELYSLIETRKAERPAGSYTTMLFDEGIEKILAKVDEESQETITAGRAESDQRLVEETSDLLYHLLVLLVQRGVTLDQVRGELESRRGKRRDVS